MVQAEADADTGVLKSRFLSASFALQPTFHVAVRVLSLMLRTASRLKRATLSVVMFVTCFATVTRVATTKFVGVVCGVALLIAEVNGGILIAFGCNLASHLGASG